MRLSKNGEDFILLQEGLRLTAYRCQAGVWTIGVGHTGPEVVEGLRWGKDKALEVFRKDIRRFEETVDLETQYVTLTQAQFDALVSFTFNVGVAAFKSSTLLRKLKNNDLDGAAEQFDVWNKATDPKTGEKVVIPGLVFRRQMERRLFLHGTY